MCKHRFLIAATLLLLPLAALAGEGVSDPQVLCDQSGSNCQSVIIRLALKGGPDATLRMAFEGATSLGADSFDFSAELVDPRDPQLRSRLPAGAFIPDDFPVLIQIDPAPRSNLSFRGNWTLELVTENLSFSTHTPYRILRAPVGGAFQDISVGLGSGSLRLVGAGAAFSEFVIAADLRPIGRILGGKFLRFQALLAKLKLPSALVTELRSRLDGVREDFESGDLSAAIAGARALTLRLEQSAGDDLPEISRPGVGQISPAGLLGSAAGTLRHSLLQGRQFLEQPPGGFTRRLAVQGGMSVDLSVSFQQKFVVDPEDLDISTEMLDANDPNLLSRLPPGVHVPEEFPVLLRIRPRNLQRDGGTGSGTRVQSFRGAYNLELETDALRFRTLSPLRLFKAPDGGAFEDITRTYGLGSFRIEGSGGSFSEYVMAIDLRDPETIVAEKLNDLEEAAADPGDMIPDETQSEIQELVDEVEEAVENDAPEDALDSLQELEELLENNDDIPSIWRSDDEEGNVAGELLSVTQTLLFSIAQGVSQQEAVTGDVNLDGQVDVSDLFLLIDLIFGDG